MSKELNMIPISTINYRFIQCAFLILLTCFSAPTLGLSFSPQRIIIAGRQRSATITLRNTSKKIASYRINMIDFLYQDTGVVRAKQLPPNYPSAKPFIRFSPRQVRLGPGESQTVRVLVRGPKLPDGEYRVHAQLQQLPDVSKVRNPIRNDTVAATLGISQAIALPIILRRGQTQAEGRIGTITIKSGKKANTTVLDLKLQRTGNQSLYTDLVLLAPDGTEVTQVKGIALPVPNAYRRYKLNLPLSLKQLRSGRYTLELRNREAKGEVLDRQPVR
ncbi:hypothetical protein TI03_03140 [Achromatium sp. WMS1]|nr:hypothetical protein TI03_03140 [Achromatium sp. WMS1]